MHYVGRFEEAVSLIERAIRLNPFCPPAYYLALAQAQRMAGRLDAALGTFKELAGRCRKGGCPLVWSLLGLAEVYAELGRDKEARAQVAEILKVSPNFSLSMWSRRQPYQNPDHLQRRLEALGRAGLS